MTVFWVSGGCLSVVWWLSGGCLEGVLRVSGRCLEGVCRVSMGCLNGNLVILDWSSKDRSGKSRSVVESLHCNCGKLKL